MDRNPVFQRIVYPLLPRRVGNTYQHFIRGGENEIIPIADDLKVGGILIYFALAAVKEPSQPEIFRSRRTTDPTLQFTTKRPGAYYIKFFL